MPCPSSDLISKSPPKYCAYSLDMGRPTPKPQSEAEADVDILLVAPLPPAPPPPPPSPPPPPPLLSWCCRYWWRAIELLCPASAAGHGAVECMYLKDY